MLNDDGKGNPIYSTFDGQNTVSTDVLVKFTYYGHADLNCEIDGSDYSRIDSSYLAEENETTDGTPTPFSTGISGWSNGDFNYDGVLDGSDYTLIDNAFNSQGAAITDLLANPHCNPNRPDRRFTDFDSRTSDRSICHHWVGSSGTTPTYIGYPPPSEPNRPNTNQISMLRLIHTPSHSSCF